MICIWCKRDFPKLSVEHGIPDALACPPELVLSNVACEKCNNGLSRVDHALIKQFEIITVMLGIPRKKGRKPTIASWVPVRSERNDIYINAGPGVVEAFGKPLRPATPATGISDVWMDRERGQMGFSQEFGNDPRFVPALYKIGLNLVAWYVGPEVAAGQRYDHIRAFVQLEPSAINLKAAFATLSTPKPTTGFDILPQSGRNYPMFRIMILGLKFVIDMDPEQRALNNLRGAATLEAYPLCIYPITL